MRSLMKPPALRPGDTVTVIRPASHLEEKAFDRSVETLRQMGFCVWLHGSGSLKKSGPFAASDEIRADEIRWAFSEPQIRAVFVARGGYGCQRALRLISSADTRRWKPKLLMGYSDLTYFHQWIQNQLGWVSLHSPLLGGLTSKSIRKFVNEVVALPQAPRRQVWSEAKVVRAGRAEGRLCGGTLSLLQVAGPAALPKEPLVLCLEDVNENFYRLDRMIQSLLDAGYSKYVSAIIVGQLSGCGHDDKKIFGEGRLRESLQQLTRGPILTQARFGHGLVKSARGQRLLPLGLRVSLSGKTLTWVESPVSVGEGAK